MTNPLYVLDENLISCYGTKPESLYINANKITKQGTTDDLLLEKTIQRNLLIITQDIRFVLNTLTQNKDIIYEDHEGDRYFLTGKDSFLLDKNSNRSVIKWKTKRKKRIIDFANRMPFILPLNGFYSVWAV